MQICKVNPKREDNQRINKSYKETFHMQKNHE